MTAATAPPVRPSVEDWADANQRHLAAAIEAVGARLAELPGVDAGRDQAAPEPSPDDIALGMELPPALDRIAAIFELSDFERDLLVLCAGVELDASFATLCERVQGGPLAPTFGLALASLPDAHWSAVSPGAPLRHWDLLYVGDGATLASSPLRLDERILHHLAGVPQLDEALRGLVRSVTPHGAPVPSHDRLADDVAGLLDGPAAGSPVIVQLTGRASESKRAVAALACARWGLVLYQLPSVVLPSEPRELDRLVRRWTREAALGGAALLVDAEKQDTGDGGREEVLGRFLEQVGGVVFVATREVRALPHRPTTAVDVGLPTRTEQKMLWRAALGSAVADDQAVERVTAQFDLEAPAITAAAAEARLADSGDPAARVDGVWAAGRRQARRGLAGRARVVEPRARWEDLVLPARPTELLHAIERHVRHRAQVHGDWGFAARSGRGLGITALFSGPSGAGKTLAAEVLAAALRLDLYHVDLSTVVSKYIGETETNLRIVFDAAEAGGAVLLFDEADALFGKRSEVNDSHDRYANLEVSYLLQRMEAYRGLAVLTTNRRSALDDAFERRLRFRVAFPFPDATQRAAIWRRVFPPDTPTRDLDTEALARLDATGGTIHAIALHAAFLAAEAAEPVDMSHLAAAARTVAAQLERPLTDGEIAGWT